MLLQHAIRYHEAHNWIRQQDPAILTYKSLLQHCKTLEQQCEHFIKAQQKGRAELTSLGIANTTNTIHQDAITTHPSHNTCYRCGYNHLNRECPAIGQRCHNCNGLNHFTALCKSRHTNSYNYNRHSRHSRREHHRSRHSNRSRDSSRSSSRSSSRNRSQNRCTRRQRRSPTPHPIDTITTMQDYSAPNSNTDDSSTQLKKCKDRQPTPLPPTNVFSGITFSDTEDTPDTTSEASISIHSQDEDSTDYNADYLHTRPSHIAATNNPQEESDSPISDTETESSYTLQTKNTKFSSLQDHAAYLTRPSAYSQPTSNAEKPYMSTHLTDSPTKLHKQSIVILEDEITSTPTRTCPIPLPRPSKATRINQQHPDPTTDVKPPQKSPLLPTPPAPARNHHNQHISGPSAPQQQQSPTVNRNSTITRPTTTIQLKSSLYKTFTILQQTSPTTNHHKTITDLQQLPPSATTTTSSIYRTIPTDTRTLSTTSLLLTHHSTAPDTTIHHMKIEDTG